MLSWSNRRGKITVRGVVWDKEGENSCTELVLWSKNIIFPMNCSKWREVSTRHGVKRWHVANDWTFRCRIYVVGSLPILREAYWRSKVDASCVVGSVCRRLQDIPEMAEQARRSRERPFWPISVQIRTVATALRFSVRTWSEARIFDASRSGYHWMKEGDRTRESLLRKVYTGTD